MKLIIDIPDITYKRTLEIGALQICTDNDIYRWIANGTPIPDNATKGDVIKAVFPNTESRLDENTGIMLVKWGDGTVKTFKENWWNATYKANKEKEK